MATAYGMGNIKKDAWNKFLLNFKNPEKKVDTNKTLQDLKMAGIKVEEG